MDGCWDGTVKYVAYRTSGTKLLVDSESSDASTSLTFDGTKFEEYDETYWNNLVLLLENFSGPYTPSTPVEGQIWYDNKEKFLKCYYNNAWLNIQDKPIDISQYCLTSNDTLTNVLNVVYPANNASIATRGYVESNLYKPNFEENNLTYVRYDGYIIYQTILYPTQLTVELPITMSDIKYSVICTVNNHKADVDVRCTIYNKTTKGFSIVVDGNFDTLACVIMGVPV